MARGVAADPRGTASISRGRRPCVGAVLAVDPGRELAGAALALGGRVYLAGLVRPGAAGGPYRLGGVDPGRRRSLPWAGAGDGCRRVGAPGPALEVLAGAGGRLGARGPGPARGPGGRALAWGPASILGAWAWCRPAGAAWPGLGRGEFGGPGRTSGRRRGRWALGWTLGRGLTTGKGFRTLRHDGRRGPGRGPGRRASSLIS
jgi:hypothetical protein